MCNPNDDSDNGYCDKFKLQMALHKLRFNETYTAPNGQTYVWVRFIENLEKELECSI